MNKYLDSECCYLSKKIIKEEYLMRNDRLINYLGRDKVISLPEKIRIIGRECFAGLNINEIESLFGIEVIEEKAFYGCDLKKIYIPETVKYIGKRAFCNCGKLTEVKFSPYFDGEICDMAFSFTSIEKIDLPKYLIEINDFCSYNYKLEEVALGDSVIKIKYNAFKNCYMLKEITIPSSVKIIENNAFSNCNSLKAIRLYNKDIFIEKNAFNKCVKLLNK